jgi:hypothetical protein
MNQSNKDHESSRKPKSPPPVPPPVPPPIPAATAIFRSVSLAPMPAAHSFHHSAPPPAKSFFKSHSSPPAEGQTQVAKAPPADDWSWKVDKLEPVPVFHPLERTAVHLHSIPLQTVASRISDVLKSKSITSSYQNARVDCLTESLLKFSIQLWQGSDSSTVIIEIQRRQGCCIEMRSARALVVEAAQNGHTKAKESATSANSVVQMLMSQTSLPVHVEEDCFGSALGISLRMLESKRLDENRMGLESLCTLTDSSRVVAGDAEKAASTILSDSHLQGLLEKYFVQMKLSHKGSTGSDYDDDTMDYEDGQFVGCCHILSLRLLSNVLELADTVHAKIDLTSMFWQTVLHALYYNANIASSRPLEASLSIKSLRLLQTLEPSTFNLAPSERHLHEVLMTAHQFGRQHNRSLEVESKRLMGRLGLPVH